MVVSVWICCVSSWWLAGWLVAATAQDQGRRPYCIWLAQENIKAQSAVSTEYVFLSQHATLKKKKKKDKNKNFNQLDWMFFRWSYFLDGHVYFFAAGSHIWLPGFLLKKLDQSEIYTYQKSTHSISIKFIKFSDTEHPYLTSSWIKSKIQPIPLKPLYILFLVPNSSSHLR